MKPFLPEGARRWVGFGLFGIGLIATFIALQIPELRSALQDLERSGYFGAIVVGVMYAVALTSATATLVFANIPDNFNPIVIALAGGFGAMLYDLGIFALARRDGFKQKVTNWMQAITHRDGMPRWLSITIGTIVIASPLPDELGATFMGVSSIPLRPFLLLSFGLNTLGILIITGLF